MEKTTMWVLVALMLGIAAVILGSVGMYQYKTIQAFKYGYEQTMLPGNCYGQWIKSDKQ